MTNQELENQDEAQNTQQESSAEPSSVEQEPSPMNFEFQSQKERDECELRSKVMGVSEVVKRECTYETTSEEYLKERVSSFEAKQGALESLKEDLYEAIKQLDQINPGNTSTEAESKSSSEALEEQNSESNEVSAQESAKQEE